MIKKLLALAVVALLIVPSVVRAEEEDEVISTCLEITYTLGYRSSDAKTNGQVSELQDFLIASGYLDGQTSGFFGIKTVTAVKKFQAANGIRQTGSVAALTRAKIKTISCDLSASDASVPVAPLTPKPAPALGASAAENAALKAQLQALQAQLKAEQQARTSIPTPTPQPSSLDREAGLKALQASLTAEQARLAAERAKQEALNREAQIKALQDRLAQEQANQKPYIKITSQTNAETWAAGGYYTINWAASKVGYIYFYLNQNGSDKFCYLGYTTVGGKTTEGDWGVKLLDECQLPKGGWAAEGFGDSSYRVIGAESQDIYNPGLISGHSSGAVYVTGATYTQKSIMVTSPSGGEVYHTGHDYQITWKSNGVKQVNIYACYFDGQGMNCTILNEGASFQASRLSASSGSYNYHVNTSYPNNTVGSESTFYPYYDKSVQIRISDSDYPSVYTDSAYVSIPGEVGSIDRSSQIANIASAIAALQAKLKAAQEANNR